MKKILQEEAVLLMRQHNFLSLFPRKKPILAMLHLRGKSRQEKYEHALLEAGQLIGGGADAVIVENYFGDYEDMETVLEAFSREKVDFVYGVNALHNDALGFELAKKYGAGFIQLDSVAGHLAPEEDAAFGEAIAKWRAGYSGFVIGGVRFKYQPYRSGRTLEEDLRIGMSRCDAIAVTGEGTGKTTPMEKIRQFRNIMGDFPLVVGAGMTPDTCAEQFSVADAAIVGSYFKQGYLDDGYVEPAHVRIFMRAVEQCR